MNTENTGTSRPVDVALADSNPLMLSALSEFFDRDPRFSLVATASTAEGFLEAVLRVPVVAGIVDWTLPMLGTEKLLEVLRAQSDPPRVVVYAHDEAGDIPRLAMAAGAAGFCSRSEAPTRLLDTVASVAKGQMVFPFLDVRELNKDPRHTPDPPRTSPVGGSCKRTNQQGACRPVRHHRQHGEVSPTQSVRQIVGSKSRPGHCILLLSQHSGRRAQ